MEVGQDVHVELVSKDGVESRFAMVVDGGRRYYCCLPRAENEPMIRYMEQVLKMYRSEQRARLFFDPASADRDPG